MRVLLCGEGEHEMGNPRVWDARANVFTSVDGWMQALGRRLIQHPVEFEIRLRKDLFLEQRLERQLGARPAGHGRKAKLAKWIGENEEFDVVIFMVDADSNDVRDWRRIVSEIQAGFDALAAGPVSVPCVPMSASESWLLSDPNAWSAVGLLRRGVLPLRPETIWGVRSDPLDNHPHQWFARVCNAAGVLDEREIRVEIAETTDLNALRSACPISFLPVSQALGAI